MSVLIFIRPWHAKFFIKLAQTLFPGREIVCTSEFTKNAHFYGADYFLDGVRRFVKGRDLASEEYEKLESESLNLDEIIRRDRWLRNVDRDLAGKLVFFAYQKFSNLFSAHKPEFVISNPVDNFTTDILERMARKRGTMFLSLIELYLDGRFRISSREEANILTDEIVQDEFEKCFDFLSDRDYVPHYTRKVAPPFYKSDILRRILAYYYDKVINFKIPVRNSYYNPFRRYQEFVAREKIDYLFSDVSRIFNYDWQKTLRRDRPRLFIALQFTPEATIDYWCSLEMIDQVLVLKSLLENIPDDYLILIKEHPSMAGRRPIKFYKRLGQLHPGVVLVPPKELSKKVIECSDIVATWTSSVGIEAIFQDKRVITFSRPYFWIEGIASIETLDGMKDLPEIIRTQNSFGVSIKERLLVHLLQCSAPGFYQSGSEENLLPENFKRIATGVKLFLDRQSRE